MKKTKQKFVDKTYKLKRAAAPLSFILPTRHTKRFPLLHFDEETGVNRELRYARNQKSVFVDEQDGNVLVEPVIFEDGFLMVRKENQMLQQFLQYHPLNGLKFEEVDKEKDASEELELLNLEVDALAEAQDLDISKAESLVKVIYGRDTSKMTSAEIKRDILVYARQEPEEFLNLLEDTMVDIQSKVQTFFDEGLLIEKKKGAIHFNTVKNKKRMVVVPNGEDKLFIVASFLQSDEGIEALKMLEKISELED
ncbi:MAG: hypothetical protein GOVbin1678_4 [Prokaryotic dsDNA virus sp.]|mgnify:FL=1|nr:MAG: hypothetical protein GOVbin1678_4 [Prokaryotic dsDNA virus sp.]|tara:strand:- start:56914 stop:57669 length:756 start_codon:yes stop_codon:yes gene_type:complete